MRVDFFSDGAVRVGAVALREGSDSATVVVSVECLFVVVVSTEVLVLAIALQKCAVSGVEALTQVAVIAPSSPSQPTYACRIVADLFASVGGFLLDPSEQRAQFVLNAGTLVRFGALSRPVVWGFVASSPLLQLRALRSLRRSGPRFRHRGSDENGNAANFVEISQTAGGCRYVQLRGSVPVAWSQDASGRTWDPPILVEDGLSRSRFQTHLRSLESYGPVQSVSLLKLHGDASELRLRTALVSAAASQHTLHEFDVHRECGTSNFDRLSSFVASALPVEVPQRVVLRSNCKDSVDRTGLLQAQVFLRALPLQLRRPLTLEEEQSAREMYVALNDALSLQYCGTVALRERVVREQRTTFLSRARDRFVGLLRFYTNAYFDEERHLALAILTEGAVAPATASYNEWRVHLHHGFVSTWLQAVLVVLLCLRFVLVRRLGTLMGRA